MSNQLFKIINWRLLKNFCRDKLNKKKIPLKNNENKFKFNRNLF